MLTSGVPRMSRFLPLLVAVSALVGAGVMHGLRTDRWSAKADVKAAAARLDAVPDKVGEWEGRPMEINARQLTIAEADGHLSRYYVNRRTGAEVAVAILCGRPGPLSLHSPEVCYAGSGFNISGERQTIPLTGEGIPRSEFFNARFVKPGVVPETLNVYWAWKASGGNWAANSDPRLAYVRSAVLYKLYLIRRVGRPEEDLSHDPCLDFLRAFLPELEKQVSPST
jgi:EpsI family protein